MKKSFMDNMTLNFFSQTTESTPRTDSSDRVIETREPVYDFFWGTDNEEDWSVSLQFIGDNPQPTVQLDHEHLSDPQFYALAGYCVIHRIPCLIIDSGDVFDLDPRYPYNR